MSNSLAVATVTAALANHLARIVGEGPSGGVPGARVTTLNPGSAALRDGDPLVNLYLFRVARNGFVSNRDLPNRAADGRGLKAPTIALDLDYMVTVFGDDARLEPQVLLGAVVAWLNAEPSLDRALIQATIAHTPWLAGSNLGEGTEPVRIAPMSLAPDVMARLWSEFVNVPYQLTVLYTLSVVELDVPLATHPALPVRRIGLDVQPSGPIPVRGLVNAEHPDLPLVAGGVLAVRLANPGQPGLDVRLNGAVATGVTAGRDGLGHAALLVPLTAAQPGLSAGPLSVQVRLTAPDGKTLAMSPPLSAPLHPTIVRLDHDAKAATVTACLVLPIPAGQAAALLLFPVAGQGAPSRRIALPASETATDSPAFPVPDQPSGRYLAMIETDGLQSLLDYQGGTYVGPVVEIEAAS